MPDTTAKPVTTKTTILKALADPSVIRTIAIAAACVAALVAATGGAINIGTSDDLIQELRLTRSEIGSLSSTLQELRIDLVGIDHRVERLEELQGHEHNDEPEAD